MQCVPKQAKYLILYYKIACRPSRAWFSSSKSIGDLIQETGSGYPDFHCTIYVNKLISAFKRMQREVKKRRVLRTPFWLESSARYCNVQRMRVHGAKHSSLEDWIWSGAG